MLFRLMRKSIYVYEQRLNWGCPLLGARVWVGACPDLSRFVKSPEPCLQMTRFEVETWSKEAPMGVRSSKGVRWQELGA